MNLREGRKGGRKEGRKEENRGVKMRGGGWEGTGKVAGIKFFSEKLWRREDWYEGGKIARKR